MKQRWGTWVLLAGVIYLVITVCYEYFRHGQFDWIRAAALGFMAVGVAGSWRKGQSE